MLKKASSIAAIAAGLMMLGSPAFAVAGEPYEHDKNNWGSNTAIGELSSYYQEGEGDTVADQFGLINFGNDSDLASGINICEVEVNVIGVPVLAQNDESLCINTDDDDNDDNDIDDED
ncbi:hypothetical protein [Saccharothrix xinjiangensis]|uniref:Uncharacterized protein n=1 Tax=Saccharothrix xinjiangensis TaxID=204798 RepID=A0ABV9XYC7_9PSEU